MTRKQPHAKVLLEAYKMIHKLAEEELTFGRFNPDQECFLCKNPEFLGTVE